MSDKDWKQAVAEGSCPENTGCGTLRQCMCSMAEDMADTIAALRAELEAANEERQSRLQDVGVTCACGYDKPSDVCWLHLPWFQKLRAENEASWQREQRLARNVAELKAESERLREALTHIADCHDWLVFSDDLVADAARAALKGE